MQKYKYGDGTMPEGEYYAAAEVDELLVEKSTDYGHEQAMRRQAERRIDELERALQDTLFVLKKQREAALQWANTVDVAIEQGEKALVARAGS